MKTRKIKTLLALALVVVLFSALITPLLPAALAASPSAIDPADFAEPDFEYRPGVRWWWPGNAALKEDLVNQVDYLADNGFGVVEIVAFTNGFLSDGYPEATGTNANISHGMPGYDHAAILSYDTPDYYDKLEAVVKRCNERGIVVDLNMGSGYLASDDSVELKDSQAHMALGRITLTAADTSPITDIVVPAVEASIFYGIKIQGSRAGDWDPSEAHLCAVIVARITTPNAAALTNYRNSILDFSDPKDPTILKQYLQRQTLDFENAVVYEASELVDGKIPSFTPGAAASYEVIALYSIPTGSVALNAVRENAQGKRAYVVDHMSAEACKNFVNGWLGDPDLNRIVNNYNIRGAFNDSYEFWMDRYFNKRVYELAKEAAAPDGMLGYDITKYIPSFYTILSNSFTLSANNGLGTYDAYKSLPSGLNGGAAQFFTAVDSRITYDYNQLINKAFQEGMEAFTDTFALYDADGSGILYRQQAYNPPIDTLKSSKYVGIPETEGENENSMRRVASGAHLYGKNLVTCEVFTLGNVPFNVTAQKIKTGFDTMAVSGVNNFFYHGLNAPYYGSGTEMEDGLFPEEGWRGWTTIGVEMAATDALSPYYKEMNMYAARANFAMQQGKPSSDVAVYLPLFGGAPDLAHNAITTLNRNGLTWDLINDDCIVEELTWNAGGNGKLKTAAGMTYNALIIYQQTIPVRTMEALLALAKAGAPIIFYGNLPNAQPSYAGGNYAALNTLVGTLAGQILAENSVTQIAAASGTNANVPALATLLFSVCDPDIYCGLLDNSDVRLNRRALSTGGELAYIRNSNATATRSITLKVDPSLPNAYWLDQSNGKIYKADVVNGSVTITLNPIGAIILLCEPSGVAMPGSAVSKGLPVSIDQYKVLGTTALAGTGFTLTVTADNFNTAGGTSAGVVPGAEVTRVFTGNVLGSWATSGFQGNALRYVSSPGYYTTKIQVDLDDYAENRMILDLGTVSHAATVIVNGVTVGQLFAPPYRIDITGALTGGENEITIEAQPLKFNRRVGLREAYMADKVANKRYAFYAGNVSGSPGSAGLVGPVNLLTVEGRVDIAIEAGIRANDANVIINNPASYTVSMINATGAGVVELSFVFDGEVLAKDSIAVTPKSGFIAHMLEPAPVFTYLGAGMWECAVKLMYLNNVKTNNPLDAVVISGTVIDYEPAVVTLTGFAASGDNGAGMGAMPSIIVAPVATVTVGAKPPLYSKYDLNQDGVIDEIDLLYLIYFYQWNDRDPGWATDGLYGVYAKDCDFQVNGKVDLADMIELTANYGPYDPFDW